jgi:hypothetical protein
LSINFSLSLSLSLLPSFISASALLLLFLLLLLPLLPLPVRRPAPSRHFLAQIWVQMRLSLFLLASPGLAQQAEEEEAIVRKEVEEAEEAEVVREEVVELVGQGMQEVGGMLRRRKRRGGEWRKRRGWRKQPQRQCVYAAPLRAVRLVCRSPA